MRSIHECCVIALGTIADLRELEGSKGNRVTCDCGRVWEDRDRGEAAGRNRFAWYQVEAANRESGDSIPAGVCPECRQSPCIGHPRAADPPVLNKSGGTCVCGHDAGRHGDNTCGGPQGNCACDHFEPAAGPAPRLRRGT